jgi:hypothetical protein
MYKTDPRKLVCAQCKHENEVERVYCHNCGEKLDRSLLPQLDESQSAEEMAKAGRKVKKMMNPNRFAWVRSIKTFVMIEIFAAVVAAGFLAIQAPENVPPLKTDRFPDLEVGDVWKGMMNTRPAVAVAFKEFDLNYYLRKAVKGTEGPLGIKFERAFVRLEPGLVTLSTQRNAWGLPIYNSATFKPALAGVKWSADAQGFAIGRLTIPASFAKLVKLDTVTLDALSKVFEKEIQQLDRIAAIEPAENVISFRTKPAQ